MRSDSSQSSHVNYLLRQYPSPLCVKKVKIRLDVSLTVWRLMATHDAMNTRTVSSVIRTDNLLCCRFFTDDISCNIYTSDIEVDACTYTLKYLLSNRTPFLFDIKSSRFRAGWHYGTIKLGRFLSLYQNLNKANSARYIDQMSKSVKSQLSTYLDLSFWICFTAWYAYSTFVFFINLFKRCFEIRFVLNACYNFKYLLIRK